MKFLQQLYTKLFVQINKKINQKMIN